MYPAAQSSGSMSKTKFSELEKIATSRVTALYQKLVKEIDPVALSTAVKVIYF